ncbi:MULTISPECIES: hypothetical protein [Paenibacillus]|uniref:hypothetical protein n=1 Tax=Paenibacillus TaxID=44249 RepID=UPI000BA6EB06|nr:hypothetical protein [Paenibacillus sp. 7516]PAF28455.1 hypothetical protein CHI14_27325 [Paenibacillus sp. 7516]
MITITVIVVGVIVGLIDLPGLIRRKEWKETAVYSSMLLVATFFSVIAANLWEFPSPLYIIMWIYEPVNQFLATITGT